MSTHSSDHAAHRRDRQHGSAAAPLPHRPARTGPADSHPPRRQVPPRCRSWPLTVGVDLDGVLYPLDQVIHRWAQRRTGRQLAVPTRWAFWAEQWQMSTPSFMELFAEGIRAGEVFTLGDPYPDGLAALHRLRRAGHHVHVVTARSIPGAEAAAVAATHDWLARHDVPHDEVTITDDKAAVTLDVILEDSTDQYDALDAAGRHPVLLTRPWNLSHPGRRVPDWASFARYVETLTEAV